MKKILSIILALAVTCSFVACSSDKESSKSSDSKDNEAIVEYFDENSEDLLEELEYGFGESSGMTCSTDLEVVGDGIVIDIDINEFEDIDDETKDAMQEAYDDLNDEFESMFETLQEEIPELEYWTINVCDKNGEVLATIENGDK